MQSQVSQIGTVPKLLAVVASGIILDVVGRRLVITTSMFACGASLACLPFAAPSKELLYASLISTETFVQVLETNPLNIDYASKKSQGKAYALNSLGVSLGVLLGAGIFVQVVKVFNLYTNYQAIFLTSGIIIVIFSLMTPFMVIEPPDLRKKKGVQKAAEKSMWSDVKKLLKLNY